MTFLHRMTLKKHKMTWHSVALACRSVPRRTLNLISTEHYNMKKHNVLYLYSNFQLRVESNPWLLWICLISLYDWSRKLAARSQPIRFNTKTNAIWSLSLPWLALNRTSQWTQKMLDILWRDPILLKRRGIISWDTSNTFAHKRLV